MSTPRREPSELLYDSEAALRLVDSAIQDFGDDMETDKAPSLEQRIREVTTLGKGAAAPAPSQDLLHGLAELVHVLDGLQNSRHLFERAALENIQLERAAIEQIQRTHSKLQEVSDATESAATDILSGLERATALVDDLDACADGGREREGEASDIRGRLRDEIFGVMGLMQFQDITRQQLSYASSVLAEVEVRLKRDAIPASANGGQSASDVHEPRSLAGTFDPEASTKNREDRQALADSVLAKHSAA